MVHINLGRGLHVAKGIVAIGNVACGAVSYTHLPEAHACSGDVVQFISHDCFEGQIKSEADHEENIDFTHTNPATGPLFIEGAEPGDVLAVDVLDVDIADQGVIPVSYTHLNAAEPGSKKDRGLPRSFRPICSEGLIQLEQRTDVDFYRL